MKLFLLAISFLLFGLVSCNPHQQRPTQIAPVEKPQDVLVVLVDMNRLPAPPVTVKMTVENWIRKSLVKAANEKGIPLTLYSVTKYPVIQVSPGINVANLWKVTVGVDGVSDIDTLKCIAKTLVEIPFVTFVQNSEFAASKPRKCGNAGFVPAQPSPRK